MGIRFMFVMIIEGYIFCAFYLSYIPVIQGFIVPDEIPSALSVIYSNIPKIQLGTDSRLGWGFRFGDRADAQVLLELGPQIYTSRLTNVPNTDVDDRSSFTDLGSYSEGYEEDKTDEPSEKEEITTRTEDHTNNMIPENKYKGENSKNLIEQELNALNNLLNQIMNKISEIDGKQSNDMNSMEMRAITGLVTEVREMMRKEQQKLVTEPNSTETETFENSFKESERRNLTFTDSMMNQTSSNTYNNRTATKLVEKNIERKEIGHTVANEKKEIEEEMIFAQNKKVVNNMNDKKIILNVTNTTNKMNTIPSEDNSLSSLVLQLSSNILMNKKENTTKNESSDTSKFMALQEFLKGKNSNQFKQNSTINTKSIIAVGDGQKKHEVKIEDNKLNSVINSTKQFTENTISNSRIDTTIDLVAKLNERVEGDVKNLENNDTLTKESTNRNKLKEEGEDFDEKMDIKINDGEIDIKTDNVLSTVTGDGPNGKNSGETENLTNNFQTKEYTSDQENILNRGLTELKNKYISEEKKTANDKNISDINNFYNCENEVIENLMIQLLSKIKMKKNTEEKQLNDRKNIGTLMTLLTIIDQGQKKNRSFSDQNNDTNIEKNNSNFMYQKSEENYESEKEMAELKKKATLHELYSRAYLPQGKEKQGTSGQIPSNSTKPEKGVQILQEPLEKDINNDIEALEKILNQLIVRLIEKKNYQGKKEENERRSIVKMLVSIYKLIEEKKKQKAITTENQRNTTMESEYFTSPLKKEDNKASRRRTSTKGILNMNERLKEKFTEKQLNDTTKILMLPPEFSNGVFDQDTRRIDKNEMSSNAGIYSSDSGNFWESQVKGGNNKQKEDDELFSHIQTNETRKIPQVSLQDDKNEIISSLLLLKLSNSDTPMQLVAKMSNEGKEDSFSNRKTETNNKHSLPMDKTTNSKNGTRKLLRKTNATMMHQELTSKHNSDETEKHDINNMRNFKPALKIPPLGKRTRFEIENRDDNEIYTGFRSPSSSRNLTDKTSFDLSQSSEETNNMIRELNILLAQEKASREAYLNKEKFRKMKRYVRNELISRLMQLIRKRKNNPTYEENRVINIEVKNRNTERIHKEKLCQFENFSVACKFNGNVNDSNEVEMKKQEISDDENYTDRNSEEKPIENIALFNHQNRYEESPEQTQIYKRKEEPGIRPFARKNEFITNEKSPQRTNGEITVQPNEEVTYTRLQQSGRRENPSMESNSKVTITEAEKYLRDAISSIALDSQEHKNGNQLMSAATKRYNKYIEGNSSNGSIFQLNENEKIEQNEYHQLQKPQRAMGNWLERWSQQVKANQTSVETQ